MKTIIIITIISVIAWAACSEKFEASLEVAAERLEDQIVESAGKGRVALKMQERHIAHLKERLVETKTLRKIYERKSKQRSRDTKVETGKATETDVPAIATEGYATYIKRLQELESAGERSLRHARKNYEKLQERILFLEDRKAMLDALGGLNNDVGAGGGEAQKLLKELEQDVLRAEAEFEVAQLGAS